MADKKLTCEDCVEKDASIQKLFDGLMENWGMFYTDPSRDVLHCPICAEELTEMVNEVSIQFGAGCPSGSTVDFTKYIVINMDEEMAVDFVNEMMRHIKEMSKNWKVHE